MEGKGGGLCCSTGALRRNEGMEMDRYHKDQDQKQKFRT